jgi:hypothetical protein
LTPAVGFTLQPEDAFLEAVEPLLRGPAVDYFELAPETTWRPAPRAGGGDGVAPARAGELSLAPNGFHRRFAALGAATRKPFVAHGVGLSLGTAAPADAARRRAWLARVRRDHAVFRFRWYTDHLGASSLDGMALTLPLPLPPTARAAAVMRVRLRAMQAVVPDVGVENSVFYFQLGDPLGEPAFLRRVLRAPRTYLLLDLHNVYTMGLNFGFDPRDWLARADLTRVIEIHVSGGSPSDPRWLRSGRVMRLDGHDAAVPEEVWRLLAETAPRCPRLRGVTLERMEGTVGSADAPLLREELSRVRLVLRARAPAGGGAPPAHRGPVAGRRHAAARRPAAAVRLPPSFRHARLERLVARAICAPDPAVALAAAAHDPRLPAALRRACAAADPDGVRLSGLLVARLRFERLVQGSPHAAAWFERDAAAFAAAFRRYHAAVPPRAFFPAGEARAFARWRAGASAHARARARARRRPR